MFKFFHNAGLTHSHLSLHFLCLIYQEQSSKAKIPRRFNSQQYISEREELYFGNAMLSDKFSKSAQIKCEEKECLFCHRLCKST